jgi:hypothetical protein
LACRISIPDEEPSRETTANRSNCSDGESDGDHTPRRGPSNAPPSAGAVELHPFAPGGHRPASIITAPPRPNAPKSTPGGTASTNVRFAQFQVEARKRVVLQVSRTRGHLDLSGVPPGEAPVAACALLRHPPERAKPGTPEGKWLDE